MDQPARVETRPDRSADLEQLRSASYLLDNAVRIPGTNYRVGLDPLVGLLPVAGDATTTAVSVYIVLEGVYLGVPRETAIRMVFNLVVDAVVGSIPFIGDLFDAVWKANERNVDLIETRVGSPEGGTPDRRFLLAVGAALFGFLLALGFAGLVAVAAIVRYVGGSL